MGTYAYQPDIMMHITLKHKRKGNVISQEFREAFDEVDLIIGPTTRFCIKIGEKLDDPIAMYLSDVFTVRLI
ncbi:MAG: hypothetical protein Ct9H90mP18_10030 [Gammaproteobacteria bacterium]|nr:MAG: hypothetical protein Ct9H90mP18_10030 [Gammaproteobacteria bacterium]